jgi:ABC-2 type transport system ATP-binding protein
MSDAPAIHIHDLTKCYGRTTAVDRLDLEVPRGSVFGFLGPNGAGKTTVIKVLLGLVLPRTGQVSIFGEDIFRHRRRLMGRIGAVVESPALFDYLTAYENLFYLTRLSGSISRADIDDALQTVGLTSVAHRPVKTYSYGMKQRLGIAQALLPRSDLIFLDEPTNGLDPHGIKGVRQLIRRLCLDRGITVFLSSHWLTEVEQVCDRVAIIDRGVKVCEGDVAELIRRGEKIEVRTSAPERFTEFCARERLDIVGRDDDEASDVFLVAGEEAQIPELIENLCHAGIPLLGVGRHRQTLEEIFVELTGKHQTDAAADRF